MPSAILFNGGVFKAEPLRSAWSKSSTSGAAGGGGKVKVLHNPDMDRAVARGAAYYGLVRRGKGVRIRGGTARVYYVGIETALPAVPGARPPIKALCVAPFGMEEGSQINLPDQEFGLVVGEPAEFRFLGSTTPHRHGGHDGRGVGRGHRGAEPADDDAGSARPGRPDSAGAFADQGDGDRHPGLWCMSRDNQQRWKLEFNVREQG